MTGYVVVADGQALHRTGDLNDAFAWRSAWNSADQPLRCRVFRDTTEGLVPVVGVLFRERRPYRTGAGGDS